MGGGVLVAGLLLFSSFLLVVVAVAVEAAAAETAPWSEEGPRQRASTVIPAQWESDQESLLQSCENMGGRVWIRPMSCGGFRRVIVRRRMVELIVGVISW